MVRRPHGPADTSAQDVVRRLRATGSSDPDVLYAAKQELSAPFDRHRVVCLWIIIAGTLVCCTVLLVPLGVPTVLFGVRDRRRSAMNLAVIELAHAGYVESLASRVRGGRSRGAYA
ncbi:MAG: hypothetical protein ACREND_13310 [Gemmatimonadaceae bacterium]